MRCRRTVRPGSIGDICYLELAKNFVPVVEPNGVGAEQPTHFLDQIRIGGLYDQVKVIAHQAIAVELPAGLLTRCGQSVEEVLPVNVIQENVLRAISSAYHMVNGTGELNADFARHEPIKACGSQVQAPS